MRHWVLCFVCAVFGLTLFFLGLQMPAHLRAVDEIALQKAGAGTSSVVAEGLALVETNHLGAAQLFAAAAGSAWLKDRYALDDAVNQLARQKPALKTLGRVETGSVGMLLASHPPASTNATQPFTEFIVRSGPRTKTLELLRGSPSPLVQSLLLFRFQTNTMLFPPSASSSGQALDTAIGIAGLLAEAGHLSIDLRKQVLALATEDHESLALEQVLMDLLSLGQRFNWDQLATFVAQIHDPGTLRTLANRVQRGDQVPVIFTAVGLSKNAAGVARYLTTFSETGLNDLRLSLGTQAGGVDELLRRNQQLCRSRSCAWFASLAASHPILAFVPEHTPRTRSLALTLKWLLYLLGGFLLAATVHFARPLPAWEKPLEVRGFYLVREALFALGFLLVVLLLSEPFLAQGSQKESPPFRLRLPTVGSAVAAGSSAAPTQIMNQLSLLALLLFFVLQGLIYVACLVKLAEIRRQRVPARLRLKLLENEDHLFDAGLYLGFVGTIISLILVSLGVIKPSLMAAYSSTSFGIIFVSFFKIFHLRPLRRKLLLESELEPPVRRESPEAVETLPS
jgi:hypothetical protein